MWRYIKNYLGINKEIVVYESLVDGDIVKDVQKHKNFREDENEDEFT